MRTGKMRSRVTVVSYTLTPDGAGGTTPTREEILTTWASINPVRGQRLFEYNKIIQGTWYDLTLRFREDIPINKNLVIDYGGKELILHAVINKDEKRRVIEATAYEHD